MPSFQQKTLLSVLVGAATVAAHGHVQTIIVNGVSYEGYDPTVFPYMSDPPTVIGWTTDQTDNGFVAPDAYTSGDIICHRSATNAGGHAPIEAGDSVLFEWNTWPESHKGPVIDYLASCDGDCESVDKTALEFFKIDGVGLIDGSTAPGTWGSDQLIANNNSWLVQIPSNIAPGNYVLRHEIIALHSAGSEDGAQNYPQCINLQISSSGTDEPSGVLGTALYNSTDPGILINIYQTLDSYEIPGPDPISGATNVAQSQPAVTATSNAETGGSATAASGSTTAAAVATSAAATTTAEAAAASTTASASSAAASAVTTESAAAASPASTSAAPSATTTIVRTCGGAAKARRHARDVRPH
jgi:hypothetical protein